MSALDKFVLPLAGVACLLAVTTGCLTPRAAEQASPSAQEVSLGRPVPPHLGQRIDEYVSAFGRDRGPSYAFSGYLAVARDGRWVYGRAFGKANYQRDTLADADTRFRIGSLTKQFTAVAVMQLVEREVLTLADPIGRYVAGLGEEVAAVTLHHLLRHSSGIASYTDDEALMARDREPHAVSEVLASFAQLPLHFRPGEQFEYSNSNYFLLGLALEKASGLDYEEYLVQYVLGPAGMHRTSTIDAPEAPNTATGYVRDPAGDGLLADGPFDMTMPFSAGALRSTANDLLAWDRAWTNHTLLSAPSQALMLDVDPKLRHANGKNYGYGLGIAQRDGFEVVYHAGDIHGFSSYLARIPKEGWMVVALCNSSAANAATVGDAVVSMITQVVAVAPQ